MNAHWSIVQHNGNSGFGGDIAISNSKLLRVYPLRVGLWRWEIRELPHRKLLLIGHAKTRELAKRIVEFKMEE